MAKSNGKVNSTPVPTQQPPGSAPPAGPDGVAVRPIEVRPDPEVLERPTRRHYSPKYKLRILEQTDNLEEGKIGAFLRQEGLYWSILSSWRRQREAGALAGLAPQQRGPKTTPANTPEARRVSQLEKENAKLQDQLRRLALVLDVQKKVLLLCGETIEEKKGLNSF
jgi:transposase